jgi:hypothetical protein
LVLEQEKDKVLNNYQVKSYRDQGLILFKVKHLENQDSIWELRLQDNWIKLIFQVQELMMTNLLMLLEICLLSRKNYLKLFISLYRMSGKHDEKNNMDVPGPGQYGP